MPYIAGDRADGLGEVSAVAELLKANTTLSIGVTTNGDVPADEVEKFMKSIIVTYAWVDKAS